MGDEKAKAVVDAATKGLGIDPRAGLTMSQVLDVLDRIAESPGIVGITARFAKSRVHLSG